MMTMRLSDELLKKHMGKFAIEHAGILVIPERLVHGKKLRLPFETEDQAAAWATQNYRGGDWKVIQFGPRAFQ